MFEATDKDELEVHLQNSHGQGSDSNLSELNIETSRTVESSTTYNCDECLFTPTIAESLKKHKKEKHNKKNVNILNVDIDENLVPVPDAINVTLRLRITQIC